MDFVHQENQDVYLFVIVRAAHHEVGHVGYDFLIQWFLQHGSKALLETVFAKFVITVTEIIPINGCHLAPGLLARRRLRYLINGPLFIDVSLRGGLRPIFHLARLI